MDRNNERIINLVVIVLIISGVIAVGFSLSYMKGGEVAILIRKIVAYGTVPFGLLIKGLSYLAAERDRLVSKVESAYSTVESNRQSLEIFKGTCNAQFETLIKELNNLYTQLDQVGDELRETDKELDRRLITQEARSGLQQRIGELEQQVREMLHNQLLDR